MSGQAIKAALCFLAFGAFSVEAGVAGRSCSAAKDESNPESNIWAAVVYVCWPCLRRVGGERRCRVC